MGLAIAGLMGSLFVRRRRIWVRAGAAQGGRTVVEVGSLARTEYDDAAPEGAAHGDTEQSARADAQFHLAVAEASHNLVLVQVMRGLFDLVLSSVTQNRDIIMFVHDSPETITHLTAQHEALVKAIIDGDAARARSVVNEHLGYVRNTLLQADEDLARRERAARLQILPSTLTDSALP